MGNEIKSTYVEKHFSIETCRALSFQSKQFQLSPQMLKVRNDKSSYLSRVPEKIREDCSIISNRLAQTEKISKNCSIKFLEQKYFQNEFFTYGIFMGSHLPWLTLKSWPYRSFDCCCVEITTDEGCDVAKHDWITMRITLRLNFLLIFDIFAF